MRARLRAAVSSPLERRPLGGASSHACTDGAPLCGRWLLLLIGLGLLGLDGVDDDIHLLLRQELQVLPLAQHRHLNVLAARLHNLEQRSACELDAVQRRLLRVVLFQKLLDRLHVPANRHRLPRGIVARGLRLKKPRLAVRVESHNQRRDAKRTHTTALRISLLDPRHVLRDVPECREKTLAQVYETDTEILHMAKARGNTAGNSVQRAIGIRTRQTASPQMSVGSSGTQSTSG
eukprot:5066160-Pleurochrysis_carterae.AAC.1